MEIRTFIRSVLTEAFSGLDEAMINSNTIEPGIALFIKTKEGIVDFTLYDPIQDKVYGHMGINKLSSGNWAVGGIGAEYGYGPLMYELAMTYVYPSALMPTRDGDVRGAAENVWNKFMRRGDVESEHIDEDDSDFPMEYYNDMGGVEENMEVEFMYRRYYYDGAKSLLGILKKKMFEYLRSGVRLSDVDRKGNMYWLEKYDE